MICSMCLCTPVQGEPLSTCGLETMYAFNTYISASKDSLSCRDDIVVAYISEKSFKEVLHLTRSVSFSEIQTDQHKTVRLPFSCLKSGMAHLN